MLYRSKIDCIDKIRFEIRPFRSSPSSRRNIRSVLLDQKTKRLSRGMVPASTQEVLAVNLRGMKEKGLAPSFNPA